MDEYSDYDGLGLAELVRKRQVTPAELAEAAIARIERHDPTLNAVVYKGFDDARRTAAGELPEGQFKGVPFLIKDLGIGVAGWPRTSGSRFTADMTDAEDTGLTRRYRQAGVILMGKTNTPEYGITGTTESGRLGPCRNPWNTDYSAGGSSGGSAAAVASGMVPLAHASDGLGSIRIPAACCGLVGLKVTRDRNPNLPDAFDYALGNVVDHVVSRTVRDSAAMLDATGYAEPGSPYPAPPKSGPYLDEVSKSPGRLRIAWSSETPAGRPISDEVQQALEATAELLRSLGHEVIERGLGIDYRALYASRGPAAAANFASGMQRMIEAVGREPEPDELEPLTWTILNAGRRQAGPDVMRSLQETRMLNRRTLQAFEDIDVYLCPVMGEPPTEIGFLSPVLNEPKEVNRRQARVYPYTAPFNYSGQPSLSLPLAWSAKGLPIGMMFTAKYADEATLFRLAGQLEKEAPWADRRPAVWG